MQTIKEGQEYKDLTLKFKQNAGLVEALHIFLKVASKLNTELKGFWYCSNLKEINDGTETQKATLQFMKLGDFVTKQQKQFEECSFEQLVKSYTEGNNLIHGHMATNERFFYEFLSASGFLQMILDSRGYNDNLNLINNSTETLLQKSDNTLDSGNKEFLSNMKNALELYKQELEEYIKHKQQKDTDENRRLAINSHKFYKFVLLDCIKKLNSNNDLNTKTNYLFLAKLVVTGTLKSKGTDLANKFGTEEAEKRCQVLLNVKTKLNSLDINNRTFEKTLKEINKELEYCLFSLNDLKSIFPSNRDSEKKNKKAQNEFIKQLKLENTGISAKASIKALLNFGIDAYKKEFAKKQHDSDFKEGTVIEKPHEWCKIHGDDELSEKMTELYNQYKGIKSK